MKTAAKVFLWLALIGGAIAFVVYLVLGIAGDAETVKAALGSNATDQEVANALLTYKVYMFVYAGCSLLPVLFSILTLVRLRTATSHRQLLALGILDLFFTGLIPGILVLCIKDEQLAKKSE